MTLKIKLVTYSKSGTPRQTDDIFLNDYWLKIHWQYACLETESVILNQPGKKFIIAWRPSKLLHDILWWSTVTALPCVTTKINEEYNKVRDVQGRNCDWERDGLRYKALSWSSGKPFVTDAASTPFSTILSSAEPGVTRTLLFKSGRGFLEWLSCGKREGGLVPPPDIDSVSEISDERFSSVVEDEPSGKKGKKSTLPYNAKWQLEKYPWIPSCKGRNTLRDRSEGQVSATTRLVCTTTETWRWDIALAWGTLRNVKQKIQDYKGIPGS